MQAQTTTTNQRQDVEIDWLQHVQDLVLKEDLDKDHRLYHGQRIARQTHRHQPTNLLSSLFFQCS